MWIDSHCHLNHDRFDGADAKAIAQEAFQENVDGMVTICCRISEELPQLLKITESHEKIWCSIGTPPHDASKPDELKITQEELVNLANSNSNIVGI